MNGDALRFKALLQEVHIALHRRHLTRADIRPLGCTLLRNDLALSFSCYGSASFSRLCEPWCLSNRKAIVHTLTENVGIELSDFAIRLVDLQELEKSEEELDAALAAKVANTASEEPYANFKLHHRADLPVFLREAARVTITPWWDAYRIQLLRTTPSYNHELFNLPVACLVLLSTANKATVEAVAKLQTAWVQDPNVPAKEVLTDPKTLRHYVVLTDGENKELIEDIRSGLGSTSCTFIKIAKGKADHAPLKEFINDFTFRILIPYLEAKVRLLSDAVSSKRGLMPLVSWFKGPKKPDPEPVNLEWLARQLADVLFMLRDYPAALSQYRKIASDRSEKNMRYAPAAVEMSGVAALMIDHMRKDIEGELDKAFQMYQRTSQLRLCIRATLVLAEVHRLQRNYREMVNVLLRCAERQEADDLSSALMQEQASFGLLYTAPPQFRKFAMRLLFAGHRFVNASQQKHAFRCYAFVGGIYGGRDWAHIDSHIGSVLARQSFLLQRMDSARHYMQKILETNAASSPLGTQAAELREYLHIVSSSLPAASADGAAPSPAALPELPFPQILTDSIRVFLKTSPVAGENPALDSTWAEMEDALTNESGPRKRPTRRERLPPRERICGVGENVLVELSIKNPLQVPLHLASVHLVANHRPPSDQPPSDAPAYDAQTVDITLAGQERRTLQLKLTPLRDGILEIKGLGFEAFGSVWGVRHFNLPRRRLNDTKEHMRTPTYEADSSLTFRTVQNAALLEASLLGFPSSCFQGELRRVTVELRNVGAVPVTRMRVKLSHGACFSFVPLGKADGCDQEKNISIRNTRSDPSIVQLPGVLAPNSSVSMPVWLRGPTPGVHQLMFLFCYEADMPQKSTKHRVTKVIFELRATPALKLSYTVTPSASSLHSYVLALCAENIQPNEQVSFALTQVTSFSAAWAIAPLSFKEATAESGAPHVVNARDTMQLFLRIAPVSDTLASATPGATINLVRNVLRLSNSPKGREFVADHDLVMREKEAQRIQTEIDAYANAHARSLSHSTAEITVGFISNPKKPQPPKAPPPIVDPFTLDLALFWETPNGQHAGVQHVHAIAPLSAPDSADDASAVAHNQPVRFLLKLPPRIVHNFAANRLCTQAVVLSVKNISPTDTITFHLDAMKLNTGAMEGHLPQQHHSRSGFLWTGECYFQPVSLAPHSEMSFTLYASFPRPGVYNVNRFRLVITGTGEGALSPPKDVYPTAQYLVTVADETAV